MNFLIILIFTLSLPVKAELFYECREGKCDEVIRVSIDSDYRVLDSAKHLEINKCYKRKASGFTYFYKIESINGHFIDVLYERLSEKRSFEYMLYREKIAFQDSELNGSIQKFPCDFTPKLWDKSYIASCVGKRNKRKNFCNRPHRAPKDFRKGARP